MIENDHFWAGDFDLTRNKGFGIKNHWLYWASFLNDLTVGVAVTEGPFSLTVSDYLAWFHRQEIPF